MFLSDTHSRRVSPFAIGKSYGPAVTNSLPRISIPVGQVRLPAREADKLPRDRTSKILVHEPAFHLVCLFAALNRRSIKKMSARQSKSRRRNRTCATIPRSPSKHKMKRAQLQYAPTSKSRRPLYNHRGSGASMRSRNTGDRFLNRCQRPGK